jgi:predicted nucleotidyltransferase
MLQTVAEALGVDFRKRLVFVGGCTTALFITDEVTLEDVRATDDVDLIVDLAGYVDWAQLQEELRQRGFRESQEDNVVCRMRLGDLKVDFMPDDADILGFSNRWYAKGMETSVDHTLTDGLTIKRLAPELFVATKLEAYLGRGQGDLFTSRDMEDVLLIIDGRPEIVDEILGADAEIREFIAEQITALLEDADFEYFLEGNVRGPVGRSEIIRGRFVAISQGGG